MELSSLQSFEKMSHGSIPHALFGSHGTHPLQVLKEMKTETIFDTEKKSY